MLAGSTRPAAYLATAATALLAMPLGAQVPAALPAVAPAPPPDTLDPASPMAPLPELGVPWPTIAPADQPIAGAAADAVPADDLRRYRVEVAGLDGLPEFRGRFDQLSALRAGAGKPANAAQIDARAHDDEDLARQLLRAIGRYDGTAAASVVAPPGGETVVRLTIDAGPLYTFAGVELPGLDAAGARASTLRAAFAVKPGDPVDADKVNAAVLGFRAALSNSGYPFAAVADPRVAIDHAAHAASLALPVTLGPLARFGRIVVTDARPLFLAPPHRRYRPLPPRPAI